MRIIFYKLAIQVNDATTTICSGDNFWVTPTGDIPAGTKYSWSAPTSTTISGMAAGTNQTVVSGALTNASNAPATVTYTVTPTNGSQTGSPFQVAVTVYPHPQENTISQSAIVCSADDTLSVILAGPSTETTTGFTYQWQKATASTGPWSTIAGANAADYTPNFRDNVGTTYYQRIKEWTILHGSACENTSNPISVTYPGVITIGDITTTIAPLTFCAGVNVSIPLAGTVTTAAGMSSEIKYQYRDLPSGEWTDIAGTTFTRNNIQNNVEIRYVAHIQGCTEFNLTSNNVLTITVNQPIAFTLASSAGTSICSNTSTILSANITSGTAQSYNWSNGTNGNTTTIQPTTSGDYTLTITDNNGCTSTETIAITVNQPVAFNLVSSAGNSICQNATTTLSANITSGTAQSYLWSDNTTDATLALPEVPTGVNTYNESYAVTITDNNGCTSTDNITITRRKTPKKLKIIVLHQCADSTTFALTGCRNVWTTNWNDWDQVTNTEINGKDSAVFNFVYDPVVCNTSITYGFGGQEGWGSNKCEIDTSITINYPACEVPISSLDKNSEGNYIFAKYTACNGTTIPTFKSELEATFTTTSCSDLEFTYPTTLEEGATITENVSGNVTVKDKTTGLESVVEVTIIKHTNLSFDFYYNPGTEVCQGNLLQISITNVTGGTTNLTYNWSGEGETSTEATFTPSTATIGNKQYAVIVTDEAGCSATKSTATINVVTNSVITKSYNETICTGESFTVTPITEEGALIQTGTTYSWAAPTCDAGIAGGSASTTGATSISGTLTNSGIATGYATYSVTPHVADCSGVPFEVKVAVSPSIANGTNDLTTNKNVTITLFYSACDTNLVWNTIKPEFTTNITEYQSTSTLTLKTAPATPLTQGTYNVIWSLKDPCGNEVDLTQTVTVEYPACTGTVADVDGNNYGMVRVGCDCWTTSNMKTTKYSDGSSVPFARAYQSEEYPNLETNKATFGLLYTWYSAVGVEENAAQVPSTTTDPASRRTYVQGVCPEGWSLPTTAQFDNLYRHVSNVDGLKSSNVDMWLPSYQGTDAIGFNAVGAGAYNGSLGTFEALLGRTWFWSYEEEYSLGKCCGIGYFCEEIMAERQDKGMGFSVRCVKMKN